MVDRTAKDGVREEVVNVVANDRNIAGDPCGLPYPFIVALTPTLLPGIQSGRAEEDGDHGKGHRENSKEEVHDAVDQTKVVGSRRAGELQVSGEKGLSSLTSAKDIPCLDTVLVRTPRHHCLVHGLGGGTLVHEFPGALPFPGDLRLLSKGQSPWHDRIGVGKSRRQWLLHGERNGRAADRKTRERREPKNPGRPGTGRLHLASEDSVGVGVPTTAVRLDPAEMRSRAADRVHKEHLWDLRKHCDAGQDHSHVAHELAALGQPSDAHLGF
mmetsp:Transcript_30756/g.89339  ORF Transcript_30756/g.89339 Transcript_30756/m.89339 type:complete len:270 (+) Transcript_30756:897-1706(+)